MTRGAKVIRRQQISAPPPKPQVVTMEVEDEEYIEEIETETTKKTYPSWKKLGPDGKPIKRKPDPAKRNAIFRKHLTPKPAVACLNELVTGLVYNVEPVAPIGNFTASVVVNDEEYRGFGSSKSLAKHAAAEAALVSFVKPPGDADTEGQEDETPWKTIASFAMYKLFANWSEGSGARVAPPLPEPSTARAAGGAVLRLSQPQRAGIQPARSRLGPPPKKVTPMDTLQPAKNLSDVVKTNSHPVMVVHQLHPSIVYEVEQKANEDNSFTFTVSAEISGQIYSGTGSKLKEAKFELCKLILLEAFDIENVYSA